MAENLLKIGSKAPAFRLANQADREVSLKDYAGRWVVLYFYPRDNTPGCTTEACEFTASLKDFEKLNAQVLGISPDTPASHRKFIEKQNLTLELLSDPDHAVMQKYLAWGEKVMYGKKVEGVIRSTVLVDPDGRIVFHWPKVKAAGHAQQVQAKLKELQSE